MMKKLLALALCILLHLTQVYGEEASSDETHQAAEANAASSPADSSRAKRAVDMRRLARGIQMLRLGKRALPILRLGKRSYPEEDLQLQDLLAALDSQYYDDDYPGYYDEPLHARYRRSADPSREAVSGDSLVADSQDDSSSAVKRSVDYAGNPSQGFGDEEGYLDDQDVGIVDKRSLGMLRLGKRPMSMLRLGKRPMNMLRLGKRPMSMLRLGKRPMSMLRLGKRPMSMLRLGKRDGDEEGMTDFDRPLTEEEEDLSAVKRPMSMLRLGKRPVNMLRLGKRPVNMLRLGKRPMSMLRLGKRPMRMLRLGKREAE